MTNPKGFAANADVQAERDRAIESNPASTSTRSTMDGIVSYSVFDENVPRDVSSEFVEYFQGRTSRSAPFEAYATLSTQGFLSSSRLTGNSNGNVYLSTEIGGFNVTEAAARVGVTAESIRKLQHDIAFDGTVDAAEQQQIKSTIARATRAFFQER